MSAPLPSGHFTGPYMTGPRFREAGDLTLDQFHHDGRVEDVWLGLQPREFAMLWLLAERPGELVADTQLAADLWRIRFGWETGSIAAHIDRLCTKLMVVGLARLIASDGEGGFFLGVSAAPRLPSGNGE